MSHILQIPCLCKNTETYRGQTNVAIYHGEMTPKRKTPEKRSFSGVLLWSVQIKSWIFASDTRREGSENASRTSVR